MKALSLVLASLLLAVALPAAADSKFKSSNPNVSVADYLTYQEQVRENFRAGSPKPLSTREWDMLDRAQADVRGILEGKEKIEDLTPDQRAALLNAQERVIAIMTGEEDERIVCRRERTVGTHFQRTTCVTVAERRQERADAEGALQRLPLPRLEDIDPNTPIRRRGLSGIN
jgi:hypothetical protein